MNFLSILSLLDEIALRRRLDEMKIRRHGDGGVEALGVDEAGTARASKWYPPVRPAGSVAFAAPAEKSRQAKHTHADIQTQYR